MLYRKVKQGRLIRNNGRYVTVVDGGLFRWISQREPFWENGIGVETRTKISEQVGKHFWWRERQGERSWGGSEADFSEAWWGAQGMEWARMTGVRAKAVQGAGHCQELGFYSESDVGTVNCERFWGWEKFPPLSYSENLLNSFIQYAFILYEVFCSRSCSLL